MTAKMTASRIKDPAKARLKSKTAASNSSAVKGADVNKDFKPIYRFLKVNGERVVAVDPNGDDWGRELLGAFRFAVKKAVGQAQKSDAKGWHVASAKGDEKRRVK